MAELGRMMMLGAALAALTASEAKADLKVEILNAPEAVFAGEPVYVLFEIENPGKEPVYLPDESYPRRGVELHGARPGESMRRLNNLIADFVFQVPSGTMWLSPGERWRYYQEVSRYLGVNEGIVSIQAVLQSGGKCGSNQRAGRRSFPLGPRYLGTERVGAVSQKVYRCWAGEIRSEIRAIEIVSSTAPVERIAREVLKKRRALRQDPETWIWKFNPFYFPKDKFLSTHWAFGALAHGGTGVQEKLRALELQPGNPLVPWVRGAIVRHSLDMRSSCWTGGKIEVDASILNGELPTGVADFLEQHRWTLERYVCPGLRDYARTEGDSVNPYSP